MAFGIANRTPQCNLLFDKPSSRNKFKYEKSSQFSCIPIVYTPYSAEFDKIKKIIVKYLPVLCGDPIYSQILSKGIRTVSRRAPSHGRWLSPSLYTSIAASTHWLQFKGTFKCGTNSCAYCPFIKRAFQSLLASPIKSCPSLIVTLAL